MPRKFKLVACPLCKQEISDENVINCTFYSCLVRVIFEMTNGKKGNYELEIQEEGWEKFKDSEGGKKVEYSKLIFEVRPKELKAVNPQEVTE